MKEGRIFEPYKDILPVTSEQSKDTIRFVCISDTHSHLEEILEKIPDGDVLIHAGDFTRRGFLNEIEAFNFALGEFSEFPFMFQKFIILEYYF